MKSRARLFGHPVHQMLVTFPVGAFGFSVATDALHGVLGERKLAHTASQALDFGLLTAALAIPFGVADFLAIPRGTRARRIGLWHAAGNAAMLSLFGASRVLRARGGSPRAAKWLSGSAFLVSGVAAWLGGELVDRHGIGVELEEHTPSALPVSEDAPTLPGYGVTRAYRPAPVPR